MISRNSKLYKEVERIVIPLMAQLAGLDRRIKDLEANSHQHNVEPEPAQDDPVKCPCCGMYLCWNQESNRLECPTVYDYNGKACPFYWIEFSYGTNRSQAESFIRSMGGTK